MCGKEEASQRRIRVTVVDEGEQGECSDAVVRGRCADGGWCTVHSLRRHPRETSSGKRDASSRRDEGKRRTRQQHIGERQVGVKLAVPAVGTPWFTCITHTKDARQCVQRRQQRCESLQQYLNLTRRHWSVRQGAEEVGRVS
jgi:hypothetical protein